MPAPIIAMNFAVEIDSSALGTNTLRAKCVIVQNKNKMVNALHKADIALTNGATCDGSDAKSVNKRAVIMKNGAPGGCPTSNLKADAINSPQSQKLAVGSIVSR